MTQAKCPRCGKPVAEINPDDIIWWRATNAFQKHISHRPCFLHRGSLRPEETTIDISDDPVLLLALMTPDDAKCALEDA